MISSSSSSDGARRVAPALLACALAALLSPVVSLAAPTTVQVPVASFGRKPVEPLKGTIWKAAKPTALTQFRGVLLAPPPGFSRDAYVALANSLGGVGFDVLLLEPRTADRQLNRVLLEDIQSGVAFMKTSPSLGSTKVLVVASGPSANAAAAYASASRQMALILDGLVLLNPAPTVGMVKLAPALKSIDRIHIMLASTHAEVLGLTSQCPAWCKGLKSPDSERSIVAKKDIIEFLLKPHG